MTSFEALIYQAAFNLARRTVIGASNSEEILAGACRELPSRTRELTRWRRCRWPTVGRSRTRDSLLR